MRSGSTAIHERLPRLGDRAEEERLLRRALDFWTRALGQRPVGYRAPYFELSENTLDLLREAGFAYDSSAMSRDEPYELLAEGRPTGLVELPVSWILDDAAYLAMPRGALSSPQLVFEIYRDEFEGAYREGTLFMLTLHPEISGHRSPLVHIERLIAYIKAKPDVWFATGRQIAEYVRQQNGMAK
jgi:peptidoglycan-N-acetylglucosamine deacetylase